MMKPTAERNYSKLEWFFYIVIIPILFITILSIILLWFLDFDVKGKILTYLNQIPVIEKIIPDSQVNPQLNGNNAPNQNAQWEQTIQELKTTIEQKNNQIKQLESNIKTKDTELAQLKQQLNDVTKQIETNTTLKQEQVWADLGKIYENMNPKNAANILSNLDEQEAANIINQMSVESKSSILEKMDPKKAASISTKLKGLASSQ
ncbi:MotE family protein [Tepidibacillus sp. LV47]|uniref:MotE family protein n=1 Tax=Tepidibacillus sp. LV47 TaxID=3398228 RepID=UPI003AAF997B